MDIIVAIVLLIAIPVTLVVGLRCVSCLRRRAQEPLLEEMDQDEATP